jgi:hypothetical protein
MIGIKESMCGGGVDSKQEQPGNIEREKETLRKEQKEMLEIKPHVIVVDVKNAFDSLINRLGMAEHRRICELEEMSTMK